MCRAEMGWDGMGMGGHGYNVRTDSSPCTYRIVRMYVCANVRIYMYARRSAIRRLYVHAHSYPETSHIHPSMPPSITASLHPSIANHLPTLLPPVFNTSPSIPPVH